MENSVELPTAAFASRPACCLAGCLYLLTTRQEFEVTREVFFVKLISTPESQRQP
jgi:hypothetical protein